MDPKLLEILVCPVTKGPLVYDRESHQAHCLNRTAAAVFRVATDRHVHSVLVEDRCGDDLARPVLRLVWNLIAVAVLVYSFSRITPDYLIEPILNACLILIAIKLLEEKKFRDYMQIYALCMFLLIGSSLISFSVIFLLYFCLLFALSTASLMLLAYFSQEEEMVITRNNMVKILQHAILICVISIPASGPRPKTSSRISSMRRSRSTSVMGICSSSTSFSTTVPIWPRTLSLLSDFNCSGVSELSSF